MVSRETQVRRPGFILDADFPDLGGAAEVRRPRGADHPSTFGTARVIGIDLEAHAAMPRAIDAEIGGNAADGLCQRDRGAAMQQPHRLEGAAIDRHAGAQKVVADLQVFDADVLGEGVAIPGVKFLEGRASMPDRHVLAAGGCCAGERSGRSAPRSSNTTQLPRQCSPPACSKYLSIPPSS